MEEEAKAVQELAKATGKAIDATREAGGFIAKYIAGPLEQGIGIFEDHLRYLRWERQARLIARADEYSKQSGLTGPTKPVPLKLAIPLLQAATLEEDDYLQDRYAALLVNASNADFQIEIRVAYVDILKQLTALDVENLDAIYALPFDEGVTHGIFSTNLPTTAHVWDSDNGDWPTSDPSDPVLLSLANLARLGCVRSASTFPDFDLFVCVSPTVLGRSFVNACTLTKAL